MQSCKGRTCCLQWESYYFNLYYINNCHPFNSRYSKIENVTERIVENYSSLRQYVQERISRLRDVESKCFQQSVANYSLTVNDNNSFQNLHIDTQNSSRISNFYSQDTTRRKIMSACCGIISNAQSDTLDGLAYRTNRTLNFYVMESEEHSNIMKHFELQKSLSLLIVDMQSEASYSMDSNMDFSSIGEFSRAQQAFGCSKLTTETTEQYAVRCAILSCNFTKISTPPWVFFTFFKLCKWYQIAQRITICEICSKLTIDIVQNN